MFIPQRREAAYKAATKVTFTDVQQAKIQDIIDQRVKAAGEQARAEAERARSAAKSTQARLDAAEAELQRLRSAAAPAGENDGTIEEPVTKTVTDTTIDTGEPPTPPVPDTQALDLAQELEEARRQLAEVQGQRSADKIKNELVSAAVRARAIDEQIVAEILSNHVRIGSSGQLEVIDPATGTPRLGADFTPLSVLQLVQQFTQERPWMVKASTRPGTGSAESQHAEPPVSQLRELSRIFGKGSSGKEAQALAKRDKQRYQQLKKLAIESGLI